MKFYQKTWFTVLMLVLCFPIGLILMWKYKKFNKIGRIIVSVFIALCFATDVYITAERTNDTVSNNSSEVQEVKHQEPRKVEQPVAPKPKQESKKTLNVSVTEIKGFFEGQGFTFKDSPLSDGTPRVLAQKSATMIELQGKDKISSATIISTMSSDDKNLNTQNLNYDISFIQKLCPKFKVKDINDYLIEIMKQNNEEKNYRVFDNSIRVTGYTQKSLGSLVINIEPYFQ